MLIFLPIFEELLVEFGEASIGALVTQCRAYSYQGVWFFCICQFFALK